MLAKRYEHDARSILKLSSLQAEARKQVDSKIKQAIYQFETVPCCICDGEEFEILSGKDRYGLYMPVVICKKCGLIQANPRMNQESYIMFYNNEYHKLYRGEAPPDEFFQAQYNQGHRIYSYLKSSRTLPKLPPELFVFEVGCGAGGILQYFKEKGCYVRGIDLNEAYIGFGRTKFNLDLSVGTIHDILFDRYPDIIIYSHVLEHVLFPKEELLYTNRILSKNGIIYIEMPGVKNLLNSHGLVDDYEMDFLHLLQNAHTYYFTYTTLMNLLQSVGFQPIFGNEIIKSVFKKCESNSSSAVPKNDYEKAMAYLKRLERLRKILLPGYKVKQSARSIIINALKVSGTYDIVKKAYYKLKY